MRAPLKGVVCVQVCHGERGGVDKVVRQGKRDGWVSRRRAGRENSSGPAVVQGMGIMAAVPT